MRRLLQPVFVLFLSLFAALAQAGALDAISTGDASAGVKEALNKGADYAVASLGKNGGFLGNDKVKIPLPGLSAERPSRPCACSAWASRPTNWSRR